MRSTRERVSVVATRQDVADASWFALQVRLLGDDLEHLVVGHVVVGFLGGFLDEFPLEAELGTFVHDIDSLVVERERRHSWL